MRKEFSKKLKNKGLRSKRTRKQIVGKNVKPRLSVFRSLKHISVQLIDDTKGVTLCSASDKDVKAKKKPMEVATEVGTIVAQRAAEKKVTEVVFDRGSYKYHGRVKALAEAARKAGLKF